MNKLTPHLPLLCTMLSLGACEHAENYRWSWQVSTVMPAPTAAPDNSEFNWIGPSVSVYTYGSAPPATPTVSITGLSDRGQAAFIEKLSEKGADPEKLGAVLSKPLGASDPSTEASATIDESYSRTLVATVAEGLDAGPADRLVWVWVDIRPQNFVFDGYTIVATDNETLNIESIQNQTTASLQGQLGDTTSKTGGISSTTAPPSATGGTTVANSISKVLGASAGVTGNLSNQYTTSATVNQQYEKLHVDIVPHELRIFHGSERNLDATGNTLVALTMRVDPEEKFIREMIVDRVTKLSLTDNGALLPPTKIELTIALEKSPPPCPLLADVTLLYELRKVKDGRSYVEGQQSPEYIQDSTPKRTLTLVPANVVRRPSWSIYAQSDHDRVNPVEVADLFNQPLPIDFTSFEQAHEFMAWMNEHTSWVATDPTRKLGSSSYTLVTNGAKPPFIAAPFNDPHLKEDCPAMATSIPR